jgi:hypothetical protein
MTRQTIIKVPKGADLLIPTSEVAMLGQLRFVELLEGGQIKLLPTATIQALTMEIPEEAIAAVELEHRQSLVTKLGAQP